MNNLDFLVELEKRLKDYEEVVYSKKREGLMASNTVKTYLTHSQNFVRWCNGEFNPGERNR